MRDKRWQEHAVGEHDDPLSPLLLIGCVILSSAAVSGAWVVLITLRVNLAEGEGRERVFDHEILLLPSFV